MRFWQVTDHEIIDVIVVCSQQCALDYSVLHDFSDDDIDNCLEEFPVEEEPNYYGPCPRCKKSMSPAQEGNSDE